MFKCENCGGELVYSIKDKKLKCNACNSLFEISDMLDENEENAETLDMSVFTCPNCGGEIYSTSSTAASFCSFCGSHVTLTQKMVQWKKPDYIIPFTVTREKAKELVVERLRQKLFVPTVLKNPDNLDICRGIYIPYWVYETEGNMTFSTDCETISGDRHSVYRITGETDSNYIGLNHDASDSFADDIGNNLNPYNLGDAESFNSAYLCGFFADMADKRSERFTNDIVRDATKLMQTDVKDYLDKKYRDLDVIPTPSGGISNVKGAKLCLFPVWLVSYKTKDSVAYFAVNGVTEKVVADTPVAKEKFFKVSCILSVLLAVICYFAVNNTAHTVVYPLGIFTILNAVGLHIGNKRIEKKETEDTGKKNYWLMTSILVLVSLFGFWFGMSDIPTDELYYVYAVVEIIFNIIGLVNGINHLNLITARKLPQFSYKGKDIV